MLIEPDKISAAGQNAGGWSLVTTNWSCRYQVPLIWNLRGSPDERARTILL